MGDKDYQGDVHEGLFLSAIKHFNFTSKRVLDVGAGNGWCGKEFERKGATVTSIDINPPNDKIIKMDVENIKYEDCSFNFVNSHGTLHHCKRPIIAVKEIYRVLEYGGYLLLTGEATLKPTWWGYLNRYFFQYIILPFRDYDEWRSNGRMFFQREYDRWCKLTGFNKVAKDIYQKQVGYLR